MLTYIDFTGTYRSGLEIDEDSGRNNFSPFPFPTYCLGYLWGADWNKNENKK